MFANYLDNEIEDYFVVVQNESIIACGGLNYDYDKKEAVLSWGMVHPTYQGWGIGSQLTEHRIKHLHPVQGIDKLMVRTSQHTYKFYEKMGFELKSVTNNYWGPNLHLHVMQMKVWPFRYFLSFSTLLTSTFFCTISSTISALSLALSSCKSL